MMKTVKNKCGAEGGARNHAQALTIEDMMKIVNTSEKQCPLWCLGGSPTYQTNASFKASVVDHVLMQGFLMSAFTLWTRYDVSTIYFESGLIHIPGIRNYATYRGGL
jgi:hypothetical protein